MKQNKMTFKKILEQIKRQNSERLMGKARAANGLAKRTGGNNRRNAYNVKTDALCWLVRKLPDCVRISQDVGLADFVVVGLKCGQSGLHLPFAKLVN